MVCRVKQQSSIAKSLLKKSSDPAASPSKLLAAKVKKYLEKDFTNQLIQEAQALGWRVAHFPPIHTASGHWLTAVKADGKGWLDLFLLRRKHKMVLELKTETQLSDEQIQWAAAFQEADIPVYVVIPADWDFIRDLLQKGPH